MANTPNLNMGYLEEGQSKAEVTVNESLNIIDALLSQGVLDFDPSPPVNPSDGDAYIVSSSGASGPWTLKENQIAIYYKGWRFIQAREGMQVYVRDAVFKCRVMWNGTAWVIPGPVTSLTQSISNPPTQAQVTAIQDKLNTLLAELKEVGGLRV